MIARRFALPAALAALFAAGCGGGPTASPLGDRVEVKGKITLAGSAFSKGTVAFFPTDDKGSETSAPIGAGGEYAIKVFPGKYTVAVEPEHVRAATAPKPTTIPAKYQTAKKSDFAIEVPSGGKSDANFDMK